MPTMRERLLEVVSRLCPYLVDCFRDSSGKRNELTTFPPVSRDALHRHVSSHVSRHATPVAVVSTRACQQCAVSRARCSKQQPCKRCADRNIQCLYPHPKKVGAIPKPQAEAQATGSGETPDHSQGPTSDINMTPHQPGASLAGHTQTEIWGAHDGAQGQPEPLPSNVVPDFVLAPSGLSNVNWMSPPGFQTNEWDTQLSDYLRQGAGSEPFNSPFPQIPSIEMHTGLYSDMHNPYSGPEATMVSSRYKPSPSLVSLPSAKSSSSDNTSRSSTNTEGNYYADGSGYRAPFGGRSKQRYSIANVDVLQPDDADEQPIHPPSSQDSALLSAYEAMINGLSSEYRLSASRGASPPFPTYTQTQFYVQQYFENFHPAFSFLRRVTFSYEASRDWILLLAVSVVGSRYMRRVRGPTLSDSMLAALQSILRRQRYGLGADQSGGAPFAPGYVARKDDACPRIQTLQAGVLAVICMLHCGSKDYLDMALVDRHYLVEACNSLGLLSPRPASNWTVPGGSSHAENTAWVQEQTEIRTGMMIWVGCFPSSLRQSYHALTLYSFLTR